MKNLISLIKEHDILALVPTMLGVHDLLKRDKLVSAYRYYRLKTGKSSYVSKNRVDRYHRNHFLNYIKY